MGDEPFLRGTEDEAEPEDYPGEAELLLEGEEDRSGRRRVIIIIIIILLILLLLFCPVDKKSLNKQRRLSEKAKRAQERPLGAASYKVISGAPMPERSGRSRKAVVVGVWFYVKNVSPRVQVLDYSMVQLGDEFGKRYEALADDTDDIYEKEGMSSPWGLDVAPGREVKVFVAFYAYTGPKKRYFLIGRDFDWTSDRSRNYPIGVFDTSPRNPYMRPD